MQVGFFFWPYNLDLCEKLAERADRYGYAMIGIAVPNLVMTQLLPTLNVPIPLPELPFGLRIEHLEPRADGLVVTGSAAAPVFRRT